MPPRIEVSADCYAELETALLKEGLEINKSGIVEISRSTVLIACATNYRHATIRKDCAEIVSKVWTINPDNPPFIECCNDLYEFVLNNKLPDPTKKDEWK